MSPQQISPCVRFLTFRTFELFLLLQMLGSPVTSHIFWVEEGFVAGIALVGALDRVDALDVAASEEVRMMRLVGGSGRGRTEDHLACQRFCHILTCQRDCHI